eukprot:765440-Hanusia_phi.AAC.5
MQNRMMEEGDDDCDDGDHDHDDGDDDDDEEEEEEKTVQRLHFGHLCVFAAPSFIFLDTLPLAFLTAACKSVRAQGGRGGQCIDDLREDHVFQIRRRRAKLGRGGREEGGEDRERETGRNTFECFIAYCIRGSTPVRRRLKERFNRARGWRRGKGRGREEEDKERGGRGVQSSTCSCAALTPSLSAPAHDIHAEEAKDHSYPRGHGGLGRCLTVSSPLRLHRHLLRVKDVVAFVVLAANKLQLMAGVDNG